MKIDNIIQADAVQRWIERANKLIVGFNYMDEISSINTTDQKVIAERLKESLQASLITYTEEKNYGSTPQELKEQTEGRIRESGETGITNPEGNSPASEGTEYEEDKTEIGHDLSSEGFQSER